MLAKRCWILYLNICLDILVFFLDILDICLDDFFGIYLRSKDPAGKRVSSEVLVFMGVR